jgi:hypothetical protein
MQPEQNAAFVACMEDVLELYQQHAYSIGIDQ